MLKKAVEKIIWISAGIVIWHLGSMMTTPLFVPSPFAVINALCGLISSDQLFQGLIYSFSRITIAALISMALAVPMAMLVCMCKRAKQIVQPIVSAMRYIPVTAFSPLLILWFGIEETMKISFLFLATFVYLLPSTILCLEEVPKDLIDTGRSIGMRSHEIISEILLPAALPSIVNSFLMMYGIGWTYVAVVEAVNAKFGLGFIINVGAARGKTSVVFASILVIVVFSYLFDFIGHKIIRKVFRWRYLNDHIE